MGKPTSKKPTTKSSTKKTTINNASVTEIKNILRNTIGAFSRRLRVLERKERVGNERVRQGSNLSSNSYPDSYLRPDASMGMSSNIQAQRSPIIYSMPYTPGEKPKFSGMQSKTPPITFLENLKIYLRRIPSHGREFDVIKECLEGEARDWARVYTARWNTIDDFEKDFLETYWGEAEQSLLRRKIAHSVWDRRANATMLGHFLSLVSRARMLTYQIPERQLVNDIMTHFPKEVQYLWSLNKTSDIMEATALLRRLDDVGRSNQTSTITNYVSKDVLKEKGETYKQKPKWGGANPNWRRNEPTHRDNGIRRESNMLQINEDGDHVAEMEANSKTLN